MIHPNFLLVPAGAARSASLCLAENKVPCLMVLVVWSGLWKQTLIIRHSKEILLIKEQVLFHLR